MPWKIVEQTRKPEKCLSKISRATERQALPQVRRRPATHREANGPGSLPTVHDPMSRYPRKTLNRLANGTPDLD